MSKRQQDKQPKSELSALWPGQSLELLKALHILTRDGQLNADSRRKLKQVQHLIQILKPSLERLKEERGQVHLADVGAGKSYLGFMLYDLLFRDWAGSHITAVETRADLSQKAADLARGSNFERMSFVTGKIEEVAVTAPVDMVTALHACDTATDDAILLGLRLEAKAIAIVPCCQAEVSRQLESEGKHVMHQLWRHPIQRREFASNITNVIRGLFLEAHGYKVRVTELVGWEHSMKNELILAERHQRANAQAKRELDNLLAQLPVKPKLLREPPELTHS